MTTNQPTKPNNRKGSMRILSKQEVNQLYKLRDEGKSYSYIVGRMDLSSRSVVSYWISKRETEREKLKRLFVYPERLLASRNKNTSALMNVGWNSYRDEVLRTIDQLVSNED